MKRALRQFERGFGPAAEGDSETEQRLIMLFDELVEARRDGCWHI